MKKNLLFILSILSYSLLSAQDTLDLTMMHNEVEREYRVYVPEIYDEAAAPVSVIIALHGLTNTGPILFESSQFNLVADTAGFITVFPTALTNLTGVTGWNNGLVTGSSAEDVSFLSALIDTLLVDYNLDSDRVYFTGFSMGGFMSNRLACEMPDRIAAIASCSGTFSSNILPVCFPGRAFPMMHIHGTGDYVVDYNGNWLAGIESVEATMNFWKQNNLCSDTTLNINMPDLYEDGITVDKTVYVGCEAEVELFTAYDFWHSWMRPEHDIFASAEIWTFFRRQRLPLPVMSSLAEPMMSSIKIWPNPAENILYLDSPHPYSMMNIRDLSGRKLLQIEAGINKTSIDISSLAPGMYLIDGPERPLKFLKR